MATFWLEEKLSEYQNKLNSIAEAFANLSVTGRFRRIGSRHDGVWMLDVTANGIVLATSSASVDTPSVPNPAFTPGS